MSRVSQYLMVRSGSLMCAGILLEAGTGLIVLVKDETDVPRRFLANPQSKPMQPADAAAS